jgi:glycosyltransferase involved in cell wall biosynthesis
MRILIATSQRATVGGVETYLRDLMPALAARGHNVGLLFEHGAQSADLIDHGSSALAWCAADRPHRELLRELAGWEPDVAYLHGLADAGLEELLIDAFPVAMFAHSYHGACISGMKRFAFPGVEPCNRAFGPACLALYYPRRCGGLSPATMIRQYRLQRRRLQLLTRCASVLVASRHMREEYVRNGVLPDRVHLLPLFAPGMMPDVDPPLQRVATGQLLFVGRLADVKGGADLVAAAAVAGRRLDRQLHITIAGDGPERGRIEQSARDLGMPIEFHGWVGPNERTALMRSADLLVVPSLWPEPFGLVGLEAACVGLPAVAYDVGGIRDWLHPGESGELAPGNPPTVDGLAAALVRALADESHRARLGRGAWAVAQQFTLERHCGLLESHLERIAAHGAMSCATPLAEIL